MQDELGKLISDHSIAHAGSPDGSLSVWFCVPPPDDEDNAVVAIIPKNRDATVRRFKFMKHAVDAFGEHVERFAAWHDTGKDPWEHRDA